MSGFDNSMYDKRKLIDVLVRQVQQIILKNVQIKTPKHFFLLSSYQHLFQFLHSHPDISLI